MSLLQSQNRSKNRPEDREVLEAEYIFCSPEDKGTSRYPLSRSATPNISLTTNLLHLQWGLSAGQNEGYLEWEVKSECLTQAPRYTFLEQFIWLLKV